MSAPPARWVKASSRCVADPAIEGFPTSCARHPSGRTLAARSGPELTPPDLDWPARSRLPAAAPGATDEQFHRSGTCRHPERVAASPRLAVWISNVLDAGCGWLA